MTTIMEAHVKRWERNLAVIILLTLAAGLVGPVSAAGLEDLRLTGFSSIGTAHSDTSSSPVIGAGTDRQAKRSSSMIVSFTTTTERVNMAALEKGTAYASFAWEVNLPTAQGYSVNLASYVLGQWHGFPFGRNPLPAKGTFDNFPLSHPYNFERPAVALVVYYYGNPVEQRVITFKFQTDTGLQGTIDSLTTSTRALSQTDLAGGAAQVRLTWEVIDRQPDTNLVFQQIMPNGVARNAEYPRFNPWIFSTGSGDVMAFDPGSSAPAIRYRVRLLNVYTANVIAEQWIEIPILVSTVYRPAYSSDAYEDGRATPQFTHLPESKACQPGENSEIVFTYTLNGETYEAAIFASSNNPDAVLISSTFHDPETDTTTVYLQCVRAGMSTITLYLFEAGTFNMENPTDGAATAGVPVTVGSGDSVIEGEQVCDPPFFFAEDGASYAFSGGSFNGRVLDMCPTSEVAQTAAAFQRFEHGWMIWRQDTGQIFAFFDDGIFSYSVVMDVYVEGETLAFEQEAPEGLFAPQRGFGKAWLSYPELQALGWAVASEQGYTLRWQRMMVDGVPGAVWSMANGGRFYVPDSYSSLWSFINKLT